MYILPKSKQINADINALSNMARESEFNIAIKEKAKSFFLVAHDGVKQLIPQRANCRVIPKPELRS